MEELALAPESITTDDDVVDESAHQSTDDSDNDDSLDTEQVEQTPEEEELEEIERNGKKYAVPKSLKGEFLMQQDYTRKTQEVAETRKAIEARAAEIEQQAKFQSEYLDDVAELKAIDRQISQYADLNLIELSKTDPVQAQTLFLQKQELQQMRDQKAAQVTQKQQAQTLQMQQEAAKRVQEGRAVLEREIKGWSPTVATELMNYGKTIGFSESELAQVSNPKAVILLHKAYQFDQLMKKAATQKAKPEPQEKPVTRITASKGTATKDPSQMTDKEFAKWRQTQIRNRNR